MLSETPTPPEDQDASPPHEEDQAAGAANPPPPHDNTAQQDKDSPVGGEFEFLQGNASHQDGDMQVLAAATEEQVAELDVGMLNQQEEEEGGGGEEDGMFEGGGVRGDWVSGSVYCWNE